MSQLNFSCESVGFRVFYLTLCIYGRKRKILAVKERGFHNFLNWRAARKFIKGVSVLNIEKRHFVRILSFKPYIREKLRVFSRRLFRVLQPHSDIALKYSEWSFCYSYKGIIVFS